jgi:hypothetical protein
MDIYSNDQNNKDKRQTIVDITLHRKLKMSFEWSRHNSAQKTKDVVQMDYLRGSYLVIFLNIAEHFTTIIRMIMLVFSRLLY